MILTDYRKHRFYTINPNLLEFDPDELESFLEDPDDWYEKNGYFFVLGYSTGSSFSTVLTYASNVKKVRQEIESKFSLSIALIDMFSLGIDVSYKHLKDTKDGSAMYKSTTNATGSSLTNNDEDVGESHESFQKNINELTMVSVKLSRYDAISSFRALIPKLKYSDRQKVIEYY